MKNILEGLKGKHKLIKEKFFTKHEIQHSEKYYKTINILNDYSFIWHALLSMFIVFLTELASRWSIISAFQFILSVAATTVMLYLYEIHKQYNL